MKIEKGTYGYLNYNRKQSTIKSALGLAIIAIIFIAGYIVTKTRLNWFTFFAVLLAMPVGRTIVNFIMVIQHKPMPEENYKQINNNKTDDIDIIYDLVITSYDSVVEIDSVTIKGNTLCAYTKSDKINIEKSKKYIKDILVNNGCNVSIKIYTDVKQYINRINEIKTNLTDEEKSDTAKEREKKKANKIKDTLLDISL